MKRVHARVPATTANLGPGFDCLGCALTLYADFVCEQISSGLAFEGCPVAYQNEDNLFVRAFRSVEARIGEKPMPIRVAIRTDVPVSRGLGSSATLLVGGALAAREMYRASLTQEALLEVCNDIEGHPDNVAPALLGGLCASIVENGIPVSARVPVAGNVGFIAMIPNYETLTHEMRAALPQQVSFSDAVFNVAHAALLLRGFETGDLDVIGRAMQDRLHQPYRAPRMYEFERARTAALAAGCAAFAVSGSGSTLLGVADDARSEEIAMNVQRALEGSQYQWRVLPLSVDTEGARIIES